MEPLQRQPVPLSKRILRKTKRKQILLMSLWEECKSAGIRESLWTHAQGTVESIHQPRSLSLFKRACASLSLVTDPSKRTTHQVYRHITKGCSSQLPRVYLIQPQWSDQFQLLELIETQLARIYAIINPTAHARMTVLIPTWPKAGIAIAREAIYGLDYRSSTCRIVPSSPETQTIKCQIAIINKVYEHLDPLKLGPMVQCAIRSYANHIACCVYKKSTKIRIPSGPYMYRTDNARITCVSCSRLNQKRKLSED